MVCSAHAAPMRNCNHHLSLYVRPPPPHHASEHVKIATSAHRWGGGHYPTYFLPNIVSISNFNYSRYKLHIYRYVCWYTSFREHGQNQTSRNPLWNHHVFGHDSRKISGTVITRLPAPCYVFVSNLNFLPISCNCRCRYTSFIPQTYKDIYIYLVPESFACRQYVYVQIKSR